jgi:ferrochelatase
LKKNALVLLNLGGPDSLEAIEPFLFNLFCDPDIFKIPIGQKLFAKIISKRRAPKVAHQYEQIGGSSPINSWTEIQRLMLEESLKDLEDEFDVFTAMRYWNPITKDVVSKIENENYDKIVLLPLYPHYSITTTGSSFNEWKRCYKGDDSKMVYVNNYFDNENYIKALNEKIDQGLQKFPENLRDHVQLVFSAHGTPISLVKKGDPYSHQIKRTMELVMKARSNSHDYHLCFQSKVGPVKWLEPSTNKMIEDLAKKGEKNLLIIPIAFVSDHVETLFELDIEYRHVADKNNIENYIVMEGLNDSKSFIAALKEETLKALK